MTKMDLSGKTVFIAAGNPANAQPIQRKLESMGADVVLSQYSPIRPDKAALITEEIEGLKPDAVLVYEPGIRHNAAIVTDPRTNNGPDEAMQATSRIIGPLENDIPAIVYDDVRLNAPEPRNLQMFGVRFRDSRNVDLDHLAFSVGDAIAQQQKGARQVG